MGGTHCPTVADVIFSFYYRHLIYDEILQLVPQVHLICMVRCYQNIVVARAELGAGQR